MLGRSMREGLGMNAIQPTIFCTPLPATHAGASRRRRLPAPATHPASLGVAQLAPAATQLPFSARASVSAHGSLLAPIVGAVLGTLLLGIPGTIIGALIGFAVA
jgi:hypothetical protein